MITNSTDYSHLIFIAKLVLNGIVDDSYNKLSKEDKEFVDCYVKGEKIRDLILIANLVLSGFANDEYKNLSKEDREFVDCYVKGKKIRQQLDNDKLLNNRTNDNKFYVC